MKVTMNTCWAHPVYGGHQPGSTVKLPDKIGQELIDAGAAKLEAVEQGLVNDALKAASMEVPKKVGLRGRRTRSND